MIEKVLIAKDSLKHELEYIIIDSDISTVWNIISDLKAFQLLVPCLCDKVEYVNKYLIMKEGNKVRLIWNKQFNLRVSLLIKKKDKDFCTLIYEAIENNPKYQIKKLYGNYIEFQIQNVF